MVLPPYQKWVQDQCLKNHLESLAVHSEGVLWIDNDHSTVIISPPAHQFANSLLYNKYIDQYKMCSCIYSLQKWRIYAYAFYDKGFRKSWKSLNRIAMAMCKKTEIMILWFFQSEVLVSKRIITNECPVRPSRMGNGSLPMFRRNFQCKRKGKH